MNLSEAITYYTGLLQSGSPYGEALAWTVVRPIGAALSLDAAASRLLGGGRPVLVESDVEFTEEAEFLEGKAVYLGQAGHSTMLIEPGGFSYAARPQVMSWLSRDAQVWHLSRNVTGRRVLEYAAHGRPLAGMAELSPHMVYGADPAALEEEAAILDRVADAPWPAQKATAMAIVEWRTGARLPEDWFDHPRTVAVVDRPVAEECPPIGLWHHEPDLAARLQLSSQELRRAILLRLTHELIERFDLRMPAVRRGVRSVQDRVPLDEDLLTEIREEWESLGERWSRGSYAVRAEDETGWRRWVAANAVRHNLRSLDDGARILDGLTYAGFALDEQWPGTRDWIRGALRAASDQAGSGAAGAAHRSDSIGDDGR